MPARCLRCAADLSRLCEAGRYCPRCGLDTYSSPPAALFERARESALPAAPFAEAEWGHLAELSPADGPIPPPMPMDALPTPETSSEILRGYSNALYRLGRRYELGGGPARNRREAFRCYLKAARLGNFMAFARLASRWLEGHDAAHTPASADAPDHGKT
jgi:TPR repeat protein